VKVKIFNYKHELDRFLETEDIVINHVLQSESMIEKYNKTIEKNLTITVFYEKYVRTC
jgi:hypothetical protein